MQPGEWKDCIDAQLVQKILPKLHGSRRQVEGLLVALASYCLESGTTEEALKYLDGTATKVTGAIFDPQATARFKRSYRKLVQMIEMARRNQFTSFIQ